MEPVVWILAGIAIASLIAFCGLLLWLTWTLRRGVEELRAVMQKVGETAAAYAALGEAVPIFKRIAEQGNRLSSGMASLNLGIQKFIALTFRTPTEGISTAVPAPQPAEQTASKIYEQTDEDYAEIEARDELRKQGIEIPEPVKMEQSPV